MAKYKHILKKYNDMDSIYNVSEEERRQDLKYLSKIANKNLADLKEKGYTKYAYDMAITDLESANKTEFGVGNNASLRSVNSDLVRVLKFLNADTHTPRGYHHIQIEREKMLKEHGIDLNTKAKNFDKDKFYDFLRSEEWRKTYKDKMDSKQVFGVVHSAIKQGKEVEEILSDFEKYNQSEMTFSDIIDKYGITEWEDKKGIINNGNN